MIGYNLKCQFYIDIFSNNYYYNYPFSLLCVIVINMNLIGVFVEGDYVNKV